MQQSQQSQQCVVITGFMAAGKSVAAARLAAERNWHLVDLDQQIEESIGRTIVEIFADDGEAVFRKLESAYLQKAISAATCQSIIAAGGGVILSEENRCLLKQVCVIFLDTDFKEILRRLRTISVRRPLIAGLDDNAIRQLWESRRQLYIKTSHFVVKDIAELTELVDRIVERG